MFPPQKQSHSMGNNSKKLIKNTRMSQFVLQNFDFYLKFVKFVSKFLLPSSIIIFKFLAFYREFQFLIPIIFSISKFRLFILIFLQIFFNFFLPPIFYCYFKIIDNV